MSSASDVRRERRWMYKHKDYDGNVTQDFINGLEIFMYQAGQTPLTIETGKMFCPCRKCKNTRFVHSETVWRHLLNRGFTGHYYIWFQHGEGSYGHQHEESSSNNNYEAVASGEPSNLHGRDHYHADQGGLEHYRIHDMVTDAFYETTTAFGDNSVEEPKLDAKRFYEMLDAANQPIYDGCREGLSKLSLASRMMTIKTDHNLGEVCMDAWDELLKEYLPEDNVSAESYYEIQKLVLSLGLPSEMFDVCIDNCMIYWKDDAQL
ncbi:hypothetical protein V5N11_002255 [Cardamine amara subsp. amara]|uniref:Transposase-associated domain-containing protein n=1 Tax=Cardamine amara subsp. amara TaxID=228776 RepID=A0ABD1ALV9_CARAN